LRELRIEPDDRLLTGHGDNEDAAVVRFPAGKALVQTVDFLTPIVNDPYRFGQIAAANSLSDVYAMGGEPYSAMNIVCFPAEKLSHDILRRILQGGIDKVRESGAVMAGGHSVRDDEIKYGLSVTGTIDPDCVATNRGLAVGDQLLLTKPIGTGVLSTAIKAGWEGNREMEEALHFWCARLNSTAGRLIPSLGLKGATDITGFGLGGHILEMARSSDAAVTLWSDKVPLLDRAAELAGMGMVPGGSFANKKFCSSLVHTAETVDTITVDLIFDAQTSGGIVLSVPEQQLQQARDMLLEAGDLAAHIGEVTSYDSEKGRLRIR